MAEGEKNLSPQAELQTLPKSCLPSILHSWPLTLFSRHLPSPLGERTHNSKPPSPKASTRTQPLIGVNSCWARERKTF